MPKAEGRLSRRGLSYRPDKAIQQPTDFAGAFQQFLSLKFGKKSKIKGDSDLRLDFENRTTSDRKELTQLAIRKASLAFSDVASHGYSRSSELGGKTKHLLAGELAVLR